MRARRDSILRIGGIGEATARRYGRPANILYQLRILRMVVVKLPFAEVSEARFVDQGGRGRPGLAQVELPVARAVNRAEARQIGARAFEGGKGLRLRVVIESSSRSSTGGGRDGDFRGTRGLYGGSLPIRDGGICAVRLLGGCD